MALNRAAAPSAFAAVPTLLRVALRNVLRHPGRSLLMTLAMATGLFVLVFLKAVGDGYVAQRLESALGLSYGHVVVRPAEDDGEIADAARVAAGLARDPAVLATTARVRGEGLAKSATDTAGVMLVGVDAAAEAATTRLASHVVAGAFLGESARAGDPAPCVLGVDLARKLRVEVADRIAILAQGRDGALAADVYVVAGLFRTGNAVFDATAAYVPRASACAALAVEGDATEIVARVAVPLDADAVAARAAAEPELLGLRIESWRQAVPSVLEAMEVLRVMERIRAFVLFALVAVSILDVVAMSVAERRRELAMLAALGMRPVAVATCVAFETAIVAAHAVVLGTVASVLVTGTWLARTGIDVAKLGANLPLGLEGMSVIRPVVSGENLATAAAWVAIVAVAVALPPLWRVVRMDPADALRER